MTNQTFEQLVQQYEKLVFTVCYQLVKDYQEAQNLTQETFLTAYLHRDSCIMESVKPWLTRIAANKAKDYLNSAYFRRVELDGEEKADAIGLREPAAEDLYLAKDEVLRIQDSIYALKEPYLQVSVMYFLEEKSIDEIVLRLRRPKKTVQTQLYRAKLMLQKRLKKEVSQ